jgi:hypothetical protein
MIVMIMIMKIMMKEMMMTEVWCRVLEVVEKMESVAWKLEYDLPFFPEASPSTKRKLSPQAKHMLLSTLGF